MEFGPTKYQRVKMQARKLSIRDHLSKKSGIRRLSSQILSAQLQRSNMAEKGETEIGIGIGINNQVLQLNFVLVTSY